MWSATSNFFEGCFEFQLLPPTLSRTLTDYIKNVEPNEKVMACPDWSRGVKTESLETLIPPNNQRTLVFICGNEGQRGHVG